MKEILSDLKSNGDRLLLYFIEANKEQIDVELYPLVINALIDVMQNNPDKVQFDFSEKRPVLDIKTEFAAYCEIIYNQNMIELIENTEFIKDTKVKKKPLKVPMWETEDTSGHAFGMPEEQDVLIRNRQAEFFLRNYILQESFRHIYVKFDLIEVPLKDILLEINTKFEEIKLGKEIEELVKVEHKTREEPEEQEQEEQD